MTKMSRILARTVSGGGVFQVTGLRRGEFTLVIEESRRGKRKMDGRAIIESIKQEMRTISLPRISPLN